MNIRTTHAVSLRLQAIAEENEHIKAKSLALVSGLALDDAELALWDEITAHVANVESHALNALRRLPEMQPEEATI